MRKITSGLMALSLFISTLTVQAQTATTWESTNGSYGAVHHPVTFGIGDYGYSVTGTNNFNQNTKDFRRYNPVTDTWSNMSDFPGSARGFSIGLSYNGSGYLGFGADGNSYFRDLWRFDTANNQWTQLASCPCAARRHPAMMAANGKIYVGLGNDRFGDLKDFHVYDIATDSWTALPDIPGNPRHHPFMFTVNGEVYAGMGHGGQFIYDDWYRYDTVNNTWQTMTDFPGEARVAGTQFSHRGKGYVLSGDGSNHDYMSTGEFWSYDDQADSWNQLDPHPGVSRWAPGSFIIGDTLYFFGGVNRRISSFPTDMYKFWFNSDGISLEETPLNQVSWYPNPSEGAIYLTEPDFIEELSLLDLQGRLIANLAIEGKKVSLPNDLEGVFLLKLQGPSGESRFERIILK